VVKRGCKNNGKFALLVAEFEEIFPRLRGMAEVLATGTLEGLWYETADGGENRDGKWRKHSMLTLGLAIGWPKEHAERVVKALVDTRFLDVIDDGEKVLAVHDWLEHAPKFVVDGIRKKRNKSVNDAAIPPSDATGSKDAADSGVKTAPSLSHSPCLSHSPSAEGDETLAQSFSEWARGVLVETGKFPELTVLGVAQECQAWKGHPAWGEGREEAIEACAERARCMPGSVIGSPLQWLSKNLSSVLDGFAAQKKNGAAVAGGGVLPVGVSPGSRLSVE
jgi:hypothetical protein